MISLPNSRTKLRIIQSCEAAMWIAAVLAPIQKPLVPDADKKPFVILVAGVNGTGKTTTFGKLAKRLGESGAKVTLAAGDTFRAAAIEQLRVWADRAKAAFVAGKQGGDAAGLAFEALEKARANGSDVLLIDTAGRLQNKAGLMAELEKIARVIKKLDPTAPHAAFHCRAGDRVWWTDALPED